MKVVTVQPAFSDDRGTITDLISGPGSVDAVTIVATRAGAVRGNHLHKQTHQWAHVVSGCLLVSTGDEERMVRAGQTVFSPMGEPHAWKALEDTVCVVFVQGPRAGRDYESDTYRLDEALIS